MDVIFKANPLEAVQFISIFSYLNILSDFLIIENYLSEDDQTKQIPIVNGLYQYFEDHRDNQAMQVKLIRTLLKGSDMYGEKDDENLDVVFVNSMFDYIISSLVFDKFGNIYGFIADVVRKADNLLVDSLIEKMKRTLKNITFENEYGNPSTLTDTAAERIFTDILLPLFPKPKTNLNLFSLDYIFAQAGAIFLRPGRINGTYSTDNNTDILTNLDEENLFDEFLATGHILKYLYLTENTDTWIIKSFALPAVCYYVSENEHLLINENITNVVTDPFYWQAAYESFFEYLDNAFNAIENQLHKDLTYQLHLAFLNFYSRERIANKLIEKLCSSFNEEDRKSRVSEYIQNPLFYQCVPGRVLPNPARQFMSQIVNIGNIYKIYDWKSVKASFGNHLLKSLKYGKIKLIVPDNKADDILTDSKKLSYDLLEIDFPETDTINYYALIRENYTVTLIKEGNNFTLFNQKLGSSVNELMDHGIPIILKNETDSMNVFLEKLTEYKKNQLESYLQFSGNHQSLNSKWWNEFGFSLVPSYPYFSNIINKDYDNEETHVAMNEIQFLDQFDEDISSKIIDKQTQYLLSSIGTTIRTTMMRNTSHQAVSEIISKRTYKLSKENGRSISNVLETFYLKTEQPGVDLTFSAENYTTLLLISNELEANINSRFIFATNMLNKMILLKYSAARKVGTLNDKNVCVKTESPLSKTGYGYKFIDLDNDNNEKAQIRTGYDLKNKIIISLHGITQADEKIYTSVNNVSFELESNYIYEINNNQLRSNYTRLLFSGIPIQNRTDIECDINKYETRPISIISCPRYKRFHEINLKEDAAVKLALNKTNLSADEIRTTIQKYTFPDDRDLESIVDSWIKNKNLEVPNSSGKFIIDNHQLLLKLRYEMRLENPDLSEYDGRSKINSIYNKRERYIIEKGTKMENIIKDYNDQQARYSATFEDYYAIRNFATTGYTRITADTNEAKYMKIALYKLAIRQSDDPENQFHPRLFKVESKPRDLIKATLPEDGKTFTLTKFTLTSTSKLEAIKFPAVAAPGFQNIFYEMKFLGPYLRAEILQYDQYNEKKVILLPGSEFAVMRRSATQIEGFGECLKVELRFIYGTDDKYGWYHKIMNEITRIKF